MFNIKINGVEVPIEGVTREEFDALPDEVKLRVANEAKNQANLIAKKTAFSNEPINPSSLNIPSSETPEQKANREITERTVSQPGYAEKQAAFKQKQMENKAEAERVRTGESGRIGSVLLGKEANVKRVERGGIPTFTDVLGAASLPARAIGGTLKGTDIADEKSLALSGLRDYANKSYDEWASSTTQDTAISDLKDLSKRIATSKTLSTKQKTEELKRTNDLIKEINSNKPGAFKKAFAFVGKFLAGVSTGIIEDPLSYSGAIGKGVASLAGEAKAAKVGTEAVQAEKALAGEVDQYAKELADIQNQKVMAPVENAPAVEKVLEEPTQVVQKSYVSDLNKKYQLVERGKQLAEKSKELTNKYSDALVNKVKKETGYLPDDINRILSTDFDAVKKTVSENMLPNGDIKYGTDGLADKLAETFSTTGKNSIDEITSELPTIGEFNKLYRYEADTPFQIKDMTAYNGSHKKFKDMFDEIYALNKGDAYVPGLISDAEVDRIISKHIKGSEALIPDIKDDIIDLLKEPNNRASNLRTLNIKLNRLLKNDYAKITGAPDTLKEARKALIDLNSFIKDNRTALVEKNLKGPAGAYYRKLDESASEMLANQEDFLKKMGYSKTDNVGPLSRQELQAKAADFIKKNVDYFSTHGHKSSPEVQALFDEIGKRIGINDLNDQIQQMALAKRTGMLIDLKGTEIIPSDIGGVKNLNQVKTNEMGVNNLLPFGINFKLRASAKIFDLITKGSKELSSKDMVKLLGGGKKLTMQSVTDPIRMISAFNISSRTLSEIFNKEEITQLKQDAESAGNTEALNKLRIAESISSTAVPEQILPQKLAS